jgi:hypothetical protein
MSLSRNEDVKPVSADELLSRESTAQLDRQFLSLIRTSRI